MEKNNIGDYIKTKRKAAHLTQQELADKLYVTDKAISKWERNVGLPDITILTKLAEVLDTSVNNILNGSDSDNKDLVKELDKIREEMTINNHKHKIKIIYLSIIFIIISSLLIINNISFGYKIKKVNFSHFHQEKDINLGIPRTSFMMRYNDKSFSFKNFRNKSILENEIKNYLKTLKYLTCNGTIYYYNDTDDFSITSYSVDNHIFYNTINYTIVDEDYCYMAKLNDYSLKLGGLRKIHGLNSKYVDNYDWQNLLVVSFMDMLDIYTHEFNATLNIDYYYKVNGKVQVESLESSMGEYEIKDDKLYYYRKEITKKSSKISIPEVSTFKIDNHNMILIDDYLNKYHNGDIILK